MKTQLLIVCLIAGCMLVALFIRPVFAICNPPPTAGDDTIDCTGATAGDSTGQAGNDTITVDAGATIGDDVSGDFTGLPAGNGNDTIINNGTVTDDLNGDSEFGNGSGSDTIINNGTADSIAGETQWRVWAVAMIPSLIMAQCKVFQVTARQVSAWATTSLRTTVSHQRVLQRQSS